MPFRDTVRDYKRSALRRLEDAKELLQDPTLDAQRSDANHRHCRGAMYLSGYAAECLLKAYLIQQMSSPTLASAMDTLNEQRTKRGSERVENIARSAAGHKLLYLLQLTDLPQDPGYDPKLWGRVARWRSSWRYETDFILPSSAFEFVEDVQSAVDWLLPKIEGGE